MRRLSISLLLLLATAAGSLSAQTEERREMRYWFNNQTAWQTLNFSVNQTENLEFDVSTLKEGLHTLHLQIVNPDGKPSPTRSAYFLYFRKSTQTVGFVRWWFDNLPPKQEAIPKNGIFNLDCSKLREGLHSVHFQILNGEGTPSPTRSHLFLYHPNSSAEVAECDYWLDNDDANRKTIPLIASALPDSRIFELDVSHLATGLHVINTQLRSQDGKASPVRAQVFFVDHDDFEGKKLYYWFDDPTGTIKRTPLNAGVTLLDVSHLEEGNHTLYVAMTTHAGQISSEIKQAEFNFTIVGINAPTTDADANAPAYLLDGKRAPKHFRGIIIRKGQKLILKQ